MFRGFLTFSLRQRILMSRKIIQSGCQNWGMNSVLCDQLLGAVKKSNRHSFILCYLFRRKEFNWDINRDNNIIIILLSLLRYLSVLVKEIFLWDSLYKMSNVKNGELIIINYNLHMQRPWRHRSLKAQFRSDWMNVRALIKVLLFKARCTIKHQISFRYTACLWIYGWTSAPIETWKWNFPLWHTSRPTNQLKNRHDHREVTSNKIITIAISFPCIKISIDLSLKMAKLTTGPRSDKHSAS